VVLLKHCAKYPLRDTLQAQSSGTNHHSMIVSYSRNFIFIKTKKTASSTVEAVLEAGCVPGDIVTKYPGGVMPDTGAASADNVSGRYDDDDTVRPEKGRKDRNEFYNHMSAKEAIEKIDPDFWTSALKITVERHPYEKAVSQAFYRLNKHNNRNEPPDVYFHRVIRAGKYSSFDMWSVDDKVVVDEIMKQETLQADMERIGAKLGIPIPAVLPVLKHKTRPDPRPASEILNQQQRLLVFKRCRREFEILGYRR